MSQDKTVIHRIKKKIARTRHDLANFGEMSATKDLLNIISDMGNLLEENGFNRDPFKNVENDEVNTLHDYLPNGEPSASNYAAQAIIYAKRALELLSEEPSNQVTQDLAFAAMRAEHFSTLANFRKTKLEQDLWSGRKSRVSKGNPEAFPDYQDKLARRKALVEQAQKQGKDIIAFVAEKENIGVRSAEKYLKSKGILYN